ncbi:MAG TPA: DUF4136 domain-containing protein [Burkholderiaceae bacterium]|nr:DUF4136 domain-containing protein [Burkholderiaceae bacterium]
MVAAAGLLSGCASTSTLQAQITSFGQWPDGRVPGTYAFDRLPSQQAQPEPQQRLEDAAHRALTAAGFTAAPTGAVPDVLVQLGARITRYEQSPWNDPWGWRGGFGYGYPYGRWYGRPWVGYPYMYGAYSYGYGYGYYEYYERQVALMMRDGASGTPLYEARASSSNSYGGGGSHEVLSALFRAALADFPKSGSVPHSVDITLAP